MSGTRWVRPPLPVTRLAVGAALGLGLGVVLSLREGGPGPLVVGLVLTGLNLVVVSRSLGRLDPRRRGDPTGVVVEPRTPVGTGVGSGRWSGAGSLPCAVGRANAAAGMAVLEVGDGWFTYQLRPAGLGRIMFGADVVRGSVAAGAEAFPAKGRFGTTGIGLKPAGQAESYLWVKERDVILGALAKSGFSVSWDERRTA